MLTGKTRKRILLIQANNWRYRGGPHLRRRLAFGAYASTTLTTLASLVPEEIEAEITVIDEQVQSLPRHLDADLVGISTYTAFAPHAYQLADDARACGSTVVLGGYHPTALPHEAGQHADAVVAGYAEESWPKLLSDWANDDLQSLYNCNTLKTFQNSMPSPRRDLLDRWRYLMPDTMEATRGCPNHCGFCSITSNFLGRAVNRPVEQVVSDIERMESHTVVFLDPSPTEDLEYLKDLMRALIPLRIRWYGAATTRVSKDAEWLDLAARSGCRGLLIGFESLNQTAQTQNHKEFNLVAGHDDFIKRIHDRGIAVLGCFVFGFDADGPEIFPNTVDFVIRTGIDVVFYALLTPFPGTALYSEMEQQGRLIHKKWNLYDGKHAVFHHARMKSEEMEEGIRWAWHRTYSLKPSLARLTNGRTRDPRMLFLNMGFRILGSTFIPRNYQSPPVSR